MDGEGIFCEIKVMLRPSPLIPLPEGEGNFNIINYKNNFPPLGEIQRGKYILYFAVSFTIHCFCPHP